LPQAGAGHSGEGVVFRMQGEEKREQKEIFCTSFVSKKKEQSGQE
jgi:hypothetical protein